MTKSIMRLNYLDIKNGKKLTKEQAVGNVMVLDNIKVFDVKSVITLMRGEFIRELEFLTGDAAFAVDACMALEAYRSFLVENAICEPYYNLDFLADRLHLSLDVLKEAFDREILTVFEPGSETDQSVEAVIAGLKAIDAGNEIPRYSDDVSFELNRHVAYVPLLARIVEGLLLDKMTDDDYNVLDASVQAVRAAGYTHEVFCEDRVVNVLYCGVRTTKGWITYGRG